jgi:branched-subunit amino acid aminotransferase/4-amino-4-deoxychorismate lyase
MGVRESIDRTVPDDSLQHRIGKSACQGLGPPGGEVSEQITNPRGRVVLGEEEMGEVVQNVPQWSVWKRRAQWRLCAEADPGQIGGVSWTWCNGEYVEGLLAISPADRGLTHGLGLFETLLALDGRPVALEMHLERLRTGAERLGWNIADLGTVRIEEAIRGLLERAALNEGRARVRIAVSAGEGDLRSLGKGGESRMWITAAGSAPPPESVSLVTASFPRNEASPLAGMKCAAYAENLVALDHARKSGADECLFYNTKGELCEATTSNIFLVRGESVMTPPLASGCLPGTMRARVIACCHELGLPVTEPVLTTADLADADEVFITSALRGTVPVKQIDRLPTKACPGPVSARIRSALALRGRK